MIHAARKPGIAPLLAIAFLVLTAIPAAAAENSAFDKGLLWRVSKPGVPASYIFGTFHSAEPSLATPSPALRKVLDSADRVLVEVVTAPENTQAMAMAMVLTDGRRLSDIAGPDRFRRIVEVGARYGIPEESLDRLKPWGALGIFSVPLSELERQASAATLDRVIESTAEARGIPVLGIETAEEQADALGGNSEADQLIMLDTVLAQSDRIEENFNRMRRAYLAHDLAQLHELALEETSSAPADVIDRFFKRLIRDRNYRMADRISPHLAKGNALVAVGALHLYGGEGVPALLAQRGYNVRVVE